MMSAQDCLKNARIKLGMNQREFAELLEINKGVYCMYENGSRIPSFPKVRHMVKKLKEEGIDYEYTDFRNK